MKTTLLLKSTITILTKVRNSLSYKQKMNGTQLILSYENRVKCEQAVKLLDEVLNILYNIK